MEMNYTLHHGDCLEVLRTLPDCSVDSVVTDPPYGLSFMGKKWDYDVPAVEVWQECLRVLKPGGHLLAFAGTRTQHRMAVRIEDAGFEIRDMIAWVYGSGFPKSLDVSKAIDKAAGVKREVVGEKTTPDGKPYSARTPNSSGEYNDDCAHNSLSGATRHNNFITAPATDSARQWQGWGTALKPALEPITVARKPLVGTVAENVLEHGTGAINVDGCRVGDEVRWTPPVGELTGIGSSREAPKGEGREVTGRWPANLIHDGSEEVVAAFPQCNGVVGARREGGDKSIFSGGGHQQATKQKIVGGMKDSGSAARFFYCAKASKKDRDEGLEGHSSREVHRYGAGIGEGLNPNAPAVNKNFHPTVKPTDLMRYLCRLVTPPGGVVLDPFTGSGSTGKAAMLEGFRFIGIEREAEYVNIAKARIEGVQAEEPEQPEPDLFT